VQGVVKDKDVGLRILDSWNVDKEEKAKANYLAALSLITSNLKKQEPACPFTFTFTLWCSS